MATHWSGGQYSLFRLVFGIYLGGFFAARAGLDWIHVQAVSERWFLVPMAFFPLHDALVERLSAGLGLVAALSFGLGYRDRLAAWLLFFFYPWHDPGSGLQFVVPPVHFLLVLHCFVPAGPYGSWPSRNRPDPAGSWHLPGAVPQLVWIYLGGSLIALGLRLLMTGFWPEGPATPAGGRITFPWPEVSAHAQAALGVVFLLVPVLALWRRPRFFVWCSLALLLLLLIGPDHPLFGLELIPLFLLAFDPGWFPPAALRNPDYLFYDGHCGICHATVRFILAEDPGARFFRFAPLQGPTFQALVGSDRPLPDSVVIRGRQGELAVRSDAVVLIGRRLGGFWGLLAMVGNLVPRFLRDGAYRVVARFRHRLLKPRQDVCPILAPHLRGRFED